jgi:hypothetical protein
MNMHPAHPFRTKSLVLGMMGSFAIMAMPHSALAADTEIEKLYKEGLYLRETGKLYSAIEALEAALAAQPTLQRVRLELAVAYYRALNYERAQAEAQQVLDDPKTPDNVKLAVSTFLAQLKKDQENFLGMRNVFEPSVSIGLLHDSNVNAGPEGALLPGGLVLAPGSLAQDDWGMSVQAGIGHTYQAPNPVRIGETAARFQWKSQANLYHRGYFDLNDYNLTVATLATGPAWIAPNKWRANINLQADYLMLGEDELAWYLSAAPSFTWQTKSGEITADILYVNRDFSRDVDQGRDGDFTSAGLSYGHLFKGGKVAGQVGVRLFTDEADDSQYSNDGHEWFVGANFLAWANGTINLRYSQKEANYEGLAAGFTVARDETERRYEIGFGHKFADGKLKDWRLNGSWQHTDNQSNVPIYDYQREMTTLTLGRSF